MPELLPIYEIENEIVRTLSATRRLVLQAPTGSGKSTQVPQMLLKHGLLGAGQVVILQPRRLAARLLASRVAFEMACNLAARPVIKFDSRTRQAPRRIKFETGRDSARQMLQDPELSDPGRYLR